MSSDLTTQPEGQDPGFGNESFSIEAVCQRLEQKAFRWAAALSTLAPTDRRIRPDLTVDPRFQMGDDLWTLEELAGFFGSDAVSWLK